MLVVFSIKLVVWKDERSAVTSITQILTKCARECRRGKGGGKGAVSIVADRSHEAGYEC